VLTYPYKGKIIMKTDLQLQKDVMAELAWEPSLNPTEIGTAVKQGIVTLTGHVNSFSEKWSAEVAARRVAGVKALAIELEVNLPGASQRNDIDIARSAENVLSWMNYLPINAVTVSCENGWLTLFGEVQWEYQRKEVTGAVRHLLGVTGVSNQILIRPGVSLKLLKTEIESALKRQALVDLEHILIEIHGNAVTLSGKVNSVTEQELTKQVVWRSPGVHNVIDHLTIA